MDRKKIFDMLEKISENKLKRKIWNKISSIFNGERPLFTLNLVVIFDSMFRYLDEAKAFS